MRRRAFLGGLGAAGCLTIAGRLEAAAPRARIVDKLRDAKVEIMSRVTLSAGAPDETLEVALTGTGMSARNSRYGGLTLIAAPAGARPDAVELVSTARVGTRALATAQQIGLTFSAWSRDNYVVLPGACYAGNRFQSRGPGVYPPLLTEPADIGPNVPTIVPDIPRLAAGDGPSSLVVDATELATPAVALLLPASRLGIIVLVEPTTTAGAMEFSVRESDDRTRAFVTVGPRVPRAVGVRAPGVKTGAAVPPRALSVRLHAFDCADVAALFERLFALRKDVTGPLRLVHELPFSAAFSA